MRFLSFAPILLCLFGAIQLPAQCEPATEEPVLRKEIPVLAPISLADLKQEQGSEQRLPSPTISFADRRVLPAPDSSSAKIGADDVTEPKEVCLAIHPSTGGQMLPPGATVSPTAVTPSSEPTVSEATPQNENAAPGGSPTGPAPATTPAPAPVPYWETSTPFAPEGELRRALPAPLDPVFPGQEWVGQPLIGVPDTNPVFPLEKAIYKACPALKRARIQIYGWANPGMGYRSSEHSNIPLTYANVPRRLEM